MKLFENSEISYNITHLLQHGKERMEFGVRGVIVLRQLVQ